MHLCHSGLVWHVSPGSMRVRRQVGTVRLLTSWEARDFQFDNAGTDRGGQSPSGTLDTRNMENCDDEDNLELSKCGLRR